jgi:ketosteroid isomerase-like protein
VRTYRLVYRTTDPAHPTTARPYSGPAAEPPVSPSAVTSPRWSAGTAPITDIFADNMRWEIAGRSTASRTYPDTREFVDEVLRPFGARFDPADPFRPIRIRAVYNDEAARTVIVLWDGRGTTTIGTTYSNTYAWVMRLDDGKVVEGIAFYDSIAFNELWETVKP